MGKTQTQSEVTVDASDDSQASDRESRPQSPSPAHSAAVTVRKPAGGSPFRIYKTGQGAYVRWGSAGGAAVISIAGVAFLADQLTRFSFGGGQLAQTIQTLIPVAVLAALAYLIFRYIGQNHTVVDFMIATEGEMRKVNWSTRKQVLGHTKVVIFTVFALGIILFLVDLIFILFFTAIGVLRIPLLEQLFGGPPS